MAVTMSPINRVIVNIKRDPFETSIGSQAKTLFGMGRAIASPSTAYVYDWNMLPIGQQLWLMHLETFIKVLHLMRRASVKPAPGVIPQRQELNQVRRFQRPLARHW
jgi:hypothetical protein